MPVAKTSTLRKGRFFIPNYPKGAGGGIPSNFQGRVAFGDSSVTAAPPDWSAPLIHEYFDGTVFRENDPTTLTVERGGNYLLTILGTFNKPITASLKLGFSQDGGTTINELAEIKNYVYAEGDVVGKTQITLSSGDVFTLHVSSDSAVTVRWSDLDLYLTVD